MGGCIVFTEIMLLLLFIPLFFSFFILLNFQALKFFLSEFSRKLWGLEGWNFIQTWTVVFILCIPKFGCCCLFIHLVLHFLSLQFSNIKHFCRTLELWGIEGWNLLHTWTMGGCIVYNKIKLLLLICFFISSFFFLSNFQTLKKLSHLSQELWVLESWNLVHTWTMGGCIMFTALSCCCCLFIPFSICLSLQFSKIKIFHHTFLGNWGLDIGNLLHT